jgi:hypothetical protein
MCYGLLRPVTANGDGRQFTDGDLVRLPVDSVVFVGNGVGFCSFSALQDPEWPLSKFDVLPLVQSAEMLNSV